MKRLFILGLALGFTTFGSSGLSGSLGDDGPSGFVICDEPDEPGTFDALIPFGSGSYWKTVGDAVRACLEDGGHPIGIRIEG